MATNPIYVETEDEIPEVVERLRRSRGEDMMLVLPMRSRIGQSRFNFQLLRNYAARMGKTVTVVCDDPAVQKMASESGFAVFGAVGPQGEGIPSEPEPEPPKRRWWERKVVAPAAHVGVAPPKKLITKSATELKPGRFLLYVAAATLVMVGLFAAAVYVPSASVTLVAQAAPFEQKGVEIQAQPGKPPIKVRATVVSSSNSQSFKTTGVDQVQAALAYGKVTYTNNTSSTFLFKRGQRLSNSNGLIFAQTSPDMFIDAGKANVANVAAVKPGIAGNVGSHTITTILGPDGQPTTYDVAVDNSQATGGGLDASSKPVMTESDFDAGRAQLEQELRQTVAQQLATGLQTGEKLSETILYGAPQFNTDHQPGENVPSFSGTMTLTGEGDFYVDADVQKAFQQYLASHVPTNEQLLTESPIVVSYRILTAARGGILTFVGNASAYVAPLLDEKKILSQIVGRPLSAAKIYLQRLPIKSVTIKESPMTLPLMPLLIGRISLHYVIDPATAANPTNAPATSPPPATPKPS